MDKEKAKAYNEALERARNAYQNIKPENTAVKAMLEKVFPELAESEDERIIRCLEEIVDWGCSKNIATDCDVELKDVKKWLEKQKEEISAKPEALKKAYEKGREDALKEQKPAEWSEEEKERIQRIHDFMWKNRKGDTDTIYQIEKDADWLKSLCPQPHWKPSEKQMEALFLVSGVGAPKHRKTLESLYDDLKKL